MSQEGYKPTAEEMAAAEQIMTGEQQEMSKERVEKWEACSQLGYRSLVGHFSAGASISKLELSGLNRHPSLRMELEEFIKDRHFSAYNFKDGSSLECQLPIAEPYNAVYTFLTSEQSQQLRDLNEKLDVLEGVAQNNADKFKVRDQISEIYKSAQTYKMESEDWEALGAKGDLEFLAEKGFPLKDRAQEVVSFYGRTASSRTIELAGDNAHIDFGPNGSREFAAGIIPFPEYKEKDERWDYEKNAWKESVDEFEGKLESNTPIPYKNDFEKVIKTFEVVTPENYNMGWRNPGDYNAED